MYKNNLFIKIYMFFLTIFTIYVILDTFVLQSSYTVINNSTSSVEKFITGNVNKTSNSYEDDNVKIEIKEYYENSTKIYVADVKVKDSSYLKTAFAKNTYGKNITDKTSSIAKSLNAILAINGDYYGVQTSGYVLKNGQIYRNTARKNQEDLVIYEDGSFKIINESEESLENLKQSGAKDVLSFGPALIKSGEISVSTSSEVGKAMASNPRTAIGIISENHYVFVVSDGRTSESKGLSLYQLANFMKEKLNVEIAYNLDGGGSSCMYFNGEIVNNPTTNGNKISERSVSDIVYIGY